MIVGYDAIRALGNTTGLGNYARGILRAIHRTDPARQLELYSPKPPLAQFAGLAAELAAPLREPPLLWRGPGARKIWRIARMGRAAARNGVTLFHGLTHELPRDLAATGIPGVVTFHDLLFHRHPEWFAAFDRASYAWRYRASAKGAAAIIAVSAATRADVVEIYQVPPERVVVIPPVVDERFAIPVTATGRTAVLEGHHLPATFLLTLGTLETRKNQRVAILALAALDARHTPPLVIAGHDGGMAHELAVLARQQGVADRVLIRPDLPAEDLPAVMQSAAVFVYPSLAEGFGMPIVEALAAGAPVVTTAGGCFPEAGGPASLYVPATDAAALADAIRRVLDDSALATRMRAAGQAHAARFAGDLLAPRVLAVYDAVVARRPLPTGAP
ncbi:MAG TPA: glycosyltransferase family 1 protein [Gemmatimonadales bacterium]|nr:glycosyltransferase family 1 protein [Gemmatimonadales bacterium]